MMVADTCIVFRALLCNAQTMPLFFKDEYPKIILMDTVLGEVQRVFWFKKKRDLSRANIIEKIEFFGASVSVLQTNKTMKKYARVMEARYKICHYPDSLVLSAAKFYDLPIVTLDKDMLKIAKCEKIAIYDTRKLKDMKNNV